MDHTELLRGNGMYTWNCKSYRRARAGKRQRSNEERDGIGLIQADGRRAMRSMVMNAFETLVEAGYQPEIAYFEVLQIEINSRHDTTLWHWWNVPQSK